MEHPLDTDDGNLSISLLHPMAALLNSISSTLSYFLTNFSAIFTSIHLESNDQYTVVLHSSPLIRYKSPLYVIISVVSHDDGKQKLDSSNVKVTLVQRGWRAGFFGWSLSRYLGVKMRNGVEVTPQHKGKWGEADDGDESYELQEEEEDDSKGQDDVNLLPKPALSSKKQNTIDKQLKSSTLQQGLSRYKVISTMLVRIPASSGDGYFRFAIDIQGQNTCFSPTFRLYSLSLSSACPRGSSIIPPTLAPELLVRTLSTALYAALLALFPVAAIIEKIMPRSWARWMMTKLYRSLGMEQKTQSLMNDYNVQERIETAKAKVDRVPFARAGIRTQIEIRRDERRGAGGTFYSYT